MGALEVKGLTKRYGGRAVLNNIDFSVEEGEFFVLLGPSGGGKSTILRLVCGIEPADGGQITLGGRDITGLPPRERNIGMVFQDYGLYPHMNVFENIAYGLEARGMPKDEVKRRVEEAAAKLGLTPLIERIIVDLSGGEQQRVALARALAKNAELYLFDEPLSNLDPKLRAQARRDIVMVHRAKQKPSIYVTHDQTEALAIGDRIAIIANGRLQQVGKANDLIERPANLFVAGFIGTPAMNLLPATPLRGDCQVRLENGALLSLPEPWRGTLAAYPGEKVIVGIPAAAFLPPHLENDAEGGALSPLEAVVEDVEPLVAELIVLLKLPGGPRASAIFQGVDEELYAPGKALTLQVDGRQLCLFDPQTEQALRPTA
ncbi:MAG: ABC transporter ATP-binding protein [Chloroflexi bacterium]|nr:ABC transporter ATP-binding protein [Chloroflexota bacterium]